MNNNKLRTTFAPLYFDATKKSRAWYAMDARARALVVEMKLLYNRDTEAAVGMSSRQAAKLLNTSDRHLARRMLRQAVHYGFVVKTADGFLGLNGKGRAAEYRLTDEPHLGQPATLDFKRWNGALFDETPRSKKQNPGVPHPPGLGCQTPHSRGARHPRAVRKPNKTGISPKPPPGVSDAPLLRSSPSKRADAPSEGADEGDPFAAARNLMRRGK